MNKGRLLLFCFLMVLLVAFVLTTPVLEGRAELDFAAYWSAARLFLNRENPYDAAALYALQDSVLLSSERTSASWNPPWLLLLLAPLGLLPFNLAVRLMFLINLTIVATSVIIVWRWIRPANDERGVLVALLVAVVFHGSFMTFFIGQISTLVLISLVIGFRLLAQRRDTLAGALFLIPMIKPHLVYFLIPLLAIWVIRERRWRVVVGGMAALALSLVLCTLIYADWLSGYLALVVGHNFMQYSTSTVGGLVYVLTGATVARYAGVLLIPLFPVMLKVVDAHGWLTAVNLALLVSIPLAPYGFSFDQVVLVPVLVQCIAWVWCSRLPWLSRGTYVVLTALCAVPYWMILQQDMAYHLFTWIPLALLGLYLTVWRTAGSPPGILLTDANMSSPSSYEPHRLTYE